MMQEYDNLNDAIMYCNGSGDVSMRRDRPYDGQPHTDRGLRGKREVHTITMRDLCDCFTRAVFLCASEQLPALYAQADLGEEARICDNDLCAVDFSELDPVAIRQNMMCEVERMMGIFPNIVQAEKGSRK